MRDALARRRALESHQFWAFQTTSWGCIIRWLNQRIGSMIVAGARRAFLVLARAALVLALFAGAAFAANKKPPMSMPPVPEQVLEWDGCLQFVPEKALDKTLDDYLRQIFRQDIAFMTDEVDDVASRPTLAVSSVDLAGNGKRDLLVSIIHALDCYGGCSMYALLRTAPREPIAVVFKSGTTNEEDIPCVKERPKANRTPSLEVKGEVLSLCGAPGSRRFDSCDPSPQAVPSARSGSSKRSSDR